ncbi:hypothetical protein ElP_46140 [Tautonia plasticadhaerens]|uniref:Carboxypeptidase regulatory-like domain-containing protein n=2 Tax=Tautonia plasticadhaerens TaxID=2527974 RepID=A0A518H766_9BACT|nr:hypothetical protein ElP_46140 [Tautonia plasticadhaerens]
MAAAGLVGCGEDRGLVPVTGTVTYNGEPVAGGEILFTPQDGSHAARGPLDDSGRYRLGTYGPRDGAVTGMHDVAVILRGPDKPVPEARKGQMMEEDMQGSGDPLIPERYFSPLTSGLTAEVTDDGSNEFDFTLTD